MAFKIIGDPSLHSLLDSKRQPRGYSGKFMTIYPPSDEIFVKLIEEVHGPLLASGVMGPRILSDRQYKNNPVLHYRYGGFYPVGRVKVDGTRATYLISPEGKLVQDERLPYFQLPPWVEDPLKPATEDDISEPGIILGGRYLIESAINFSNSGGLYSAIDKQSGDTVFIKEARPFTNCWGPASSGGTLDAVFLLRREHATLEALRELDFIPDPLDLIEDGGHYFLVEEYLPAINMRKYWALNDVMLAPYIRLRGRIDAWVKLFKVIAKRLIHMVLTVHKRGFILGDLSPDNVLIDPGSMQMWLVDLESAICPADDPQLVKCAKMWGTPGFLSPRRAERSTLLPDDDFYAIGMILYYGLRAVPQR